MSETSRLAALDDTSALKRLNVLGGAREGHGVRRGEFARRALAGSQHHQHAAARGVGERGKGGVRSNVG